MSGLPVGAVGAEVRRARDCLRTTTHGTKSVRRLRLTARGHAVGTRRASRVWLERHPRQRVPTYRGDLRRQQRCAAVPVRRPVSDRPGDRHQPPGHRRATKCRLTRCLEEPVVHAASDMDVAVLETRVEEWPIRRDRSSTGIPARAAPRSRTRIQRLPTH